MFIFTADINECLNSSLVCADSNAICNDSVGSYSCPCNPGFYGDGAESGGCVLEPSRKEMEVDFKNSTDTGRGILMTAVQMMT